MWQIKSFIRKGFGNNRTRNSGDDETREKMDSISRAFNSISLWVETRAGERLGTFHPIIFPTHVREMSNGMLTLEFFFMGRRDFDLNWALFVIDVKLQTIRTLFPHSFWRFQFTFSWTLFKHFPCFWCFALSIHSRKDFKNFKIYAIQGWIVDLSNSSSRTASPTNNLS